MARAELLTVEGAWFSTHEIVGSLSSLLAAVVSQFWIATAKPPDPGVA